MEAWREVAELRVEWSGACSAAGILAGVIRRWYGLRHSRNLSGYERALNVMEKSYHPKCEPGTACEINAKDQMSMVFTYYNFITIMPLCYTAFGFLEWYETPSTH